MKLDEWTDEQVDSMIEGGGNTAVNLKYEAFIPEDVKKPKPDCPIEERTDFIRYDIRTTCQNCFYNCFYKILKSL